MKTIQGKVQGFLEEHPNVYIERSGIENGSIWATEKEIMTTANLLECDIIVYTLRGDTKKWLTYPGSFSLLKTSDKCMYLDNENEDHYNVVTAV